MSDKALVYAVVENLIRSLQAQCTCTDATRRYDRAIANLGALMGQDPEPSGTCGNCEHWKPETHSGTGGGCVHPDAQYGRSACRVTEPNARCCLRPSLFTLKISPEDHSTPS